MTTTPKAHELKLPGNGKSGRLLFLWQHDRYSHRLQYGETERIDVWQSIEGSSMDDWPASPAIQQLSTESIDGNPTVLGVGCSGTSHYSYSVQVFPIEAGGCEIHIQCAVRLAKPVESMDVMPACWLGSRYRSLPGGQLEIVPGDGTIKTNPDFDESQQWIQPQSMLQERTVQWSYRIPVKD